MSYDCAVRIIDTDMYKEILSVINEFITDKRLSIEIKQEFKAKILSITNIKKS